MAKKEDSVLGLAPIVRTGSPITTLPTPANQNLTRDQQAVITEWHKQRLVIEATAAKSALAMDRIAAIHQHGAAAFDNTVGSILDIRDAQHGKDHQQYIDEFANREIQAFARHMLGVAEVAATNIGVEVHRTLYITPEEEERGLLGRLFGG